MVDSKKLEYGPGTIDAGFPASLGLQGFTSFGLGRFQASCNIMFFGWQCSMPNDNQYHTEV